MNKLDKISKILSLVLAVLFWALLIRGLLYGFFSARSCIALLMDPAKDTTVTVNGITQNFLSIYSETGITITNRTLLIENLLSLIVSFLQTPVLCYAIHLLRKILAPIAQQRPFSGTASLLIKLGWTSIAIAVIRNVFDYGLVYQYEHGMNISRMFEGSLITEVHFHYEPDYTFVLLAVVVFILAAVFRHGEQLQQLSDETL